MFPEAADVKVYDLSDTSTVLTLRLRVLDGRPVLVGLEIGANGPQRELVAGDVRLPIRELTEAAVRAVAVEIADAAPHPFRRDPGPEGEAALLARRRRAMTDDLLLKVAQVVRDNPDRPTQQVSEQLNCSYRTAGRWVAAARERGHLPKLTRVHKDPREARKP
jgi:hypothetical protein